MKTIAARFAVLLVLALALGPGIAAGDEPAKVAGKWEITWEGRQGPVTGTLQFEQDGEKLKGTFTGPAGRETAVTGEVKGKQIKFSMKRETPRGEFTLEYAGTVDGDTMKGTVQLGPRTLEWTAKRAKEKEKEKESSWRSPRHQLQALHPRVPRPPV